MKAKDQSMLTLVVNGNDALGRLEVRTFGVLLSGHPHALTLAGLRLRSTQVREHNVTVELASVDVLSGRVEARPTVHDTLTLALLTLAPDVDLILSDNTVKRNDRKRGKASQFVKLTVERCQHTVRHRTRLVNADCDVGSPVDLATWVDVGIATIKPLWRAALVGSLRGLNEVAKHLAPVNLRREPLHDLFAARSGDSAPSLARCLVGSVFNGILDTLFRNINKVLMDLKII